MIDLKTISARIRNLFTTGKLTNRDGETIQGTTRFGRTVPGNEFHPYGFAARATKGTVLFLFEGGDASSPTMLYVSDQEGVPKLEDGDSALWTATGGWIVARESGSVELYGKKHGGIIKVEELKTQLKKNSNLLSAFLQALQVPVSEAGNGSPSSFQAALKTALSNFQVGDFSNIASDKVFHGDGTT